VRKSFILVLCLLGISFISFSLEGFAGWWQKPEAEPIKEAPKVKSAESLSALEDDARLLRAEEKITRAANRRLKEQAEELSVQNENLKKQNMSLRTKFNQADKDRENLLVKMKDYSIRGGQTANRIRALETGIIILNEEKEKFALASKALSEQIDGLNKEIEKKVEPLKKIREKQKKKLKDEREKQKKRSDKIIAKEQKEYQKRVKKYQKNAEKYQREVKKTKAVNEKLKKSSVAYLKDNKRMQEEVEDALGELADSNAYLRRLKRQVAIMHYNLGVIFDEAGKYNKAMREYKQVLKVEPDDAKTHYNMALIYEVHKENRSKAVYHYKKYLDIEPSAEDAKRVKEWITEAELEEKIWKNK